ncbi:MAG: peptide deformylase [Vicinamibacteraceae bacterium]|nr:peptide deformylase [Vicinamibacteraceae bacterium]
MRRPILRYGEAVLRDPAGPVTGWTPELQQLVDDMIETMHAAPGIGLAAPQIGVGLRLFVVDLSVGRDPSALKVLANPEFVERHGLQCEEEGCLSVPGFNATVPRPQRVVIRGEDRDGRIQTYEGVGLLARAFQHEMDHLDGRVFLHRLKPLRRMLIERRITRLRRRGRW